MRLGAYELLEVLGRGATGKVWKAAYGDSLVAVKLLDTGLSPEMNQMLTREVHALASLTHPHIVTVLDFDHVRESEVTHPGRTQGRGNRGTLVETQGAADWSAFIEISIGDTMFQLGRFQEAIVFAESSIRHFMPEGRHLPEAHANLALSLLVLRDVERFKSEVRTGSKARRRAVGKAWTSAHG